MYGNIFLNLNSLLYQGKGDCRCVLNVYFVMLSKAYILVNVNVKLKYHMQRMNPCMTINLINKASLLDYLHFKI